MFLAAAQTAPSGGKRSPDILNKRVVTLASSEGSAYGAALLGMVGTGAFSSVPEACAAVIRETGTLTPGNQTVYERGHKTYRALYPAVKSAL